jgi:hypothetical protein
MEIAIADEGPAKERDGAEAGAERFVKIWFF